MKMRMLSERKHPNHVLNNSVLTDLRKRKKKRRGKKKTFSWQIPWWLLCCHQAVLEVSMG